jgi:peptide/nickel transport system substrate-binding protein
MDEHTIRSLRRQLKHGLLSRREATRRLLGLGLTLPMAHALLAGAGVSSAQAQSTSPHRYAPTRRGGGGALRMLFWQAPTTLNPHFATGAKDGEAARVFYEGLATWDNEGELTPVLAAEIPSRANGGVAADGRSVTWKLKRGVTWHDGQPFTADDVVFNAEFAKDPATAAVTAGAVAGMRFVKVDSHTVRVEFDKPTPFWPGSYAALMILPRHVFAPFRGAASRDAPANQRPVGTGPYVIVDFKPGDLIRAVLNPTYHLPNRPHFDTLEIKGGGDSVSAARAVLQTGEYDYAWSLGVDDEVLLRLEAGSGGRGRVDMVDSSTVTFVMLNVTDPNLEVDGQRSHPSTQHPMFADKTVREAVNLLIDRVGIQQVVWGRTGLATPNFIHHPARFRSPNIRREFNVDKANALLDGAGWKRGSDGLRAKDGRRAKLLFQAAANASTQKVQQIIKAAFARAGIELELKAITPAVMFGGDATNPDTVARFSADMQMYSWLSTIPDPERAMDLFCSWEVPTKANKFQGRNTMRWRNDEYDRLYRAAETEMDPTKRAALFIRLNDLVVGDGYMIPLGIRKSVSAASAKLIKPNLAWGAAMATLADWYRVA